MNHASGKDYDPSAWARQRQERIKRASQLREKRQSGTPDRNHTFKPQLQANLDGAVSKLPLGAKVGDAAGLRQGAYDLTRLDSMHAFPRGVSANGGSNSRTFGYGDGDDPDGDAVSDSNRRLGEHKDSLDRLQVSTSERQGVIRSGGNGNNHASAGPAPPPPPVLRPPDENDGVNDEYRDDSRANGYTDYSDNHRRGHQRKSSLPVGQGTGGTNGNGRSRQNGSGVGGDALSHEIDQRPNVRGSLSEAVSPTPSSFPITSPTATAAVRRAPRMSHPNNRADDHARQQYALRSPSDGSDARLQAPDEHDVFCASLRGGGVEGGVSRRGSGGGGGGRGGGRKQAVKRPEWNNDTATAGSLGDPRMAIVTDNSPGAIQRRMESRRRSAGNDPAHESPYAPPGAVDAHNSSNTVNRNNRMENPAPGSNDSGGSSTWKHKHTKMNTMPWGEACPGSLMPGSNSGEHGKSAVSGQRNGGGRDVDESNASVRGRREGYRLQMMPSPSIGSLPLYRDPDETNGRCVDHLGGETPELAAEKDQLRHKLSLLKKKMHSQAGSRRSQSAGPRAGEVYEDGQGPNGTGSADLRHNLHKTTGTAPAMMPAQPGAFGGRERGLALGGRRAAGGRVRPPPEGPGSPYAIDPRSTAPRGLSKDPGSGGVLHHQQQLGYHPRNRHQQHLHQPQQRYGGEGSSRDFAPYSGRETGMREQGSGGGSLGDRVNGNALTDKPTRGGRYSREDDIYRRDYGKRDTTGSGCWQGAMWNPNEDARGHQRTLRNSEGRDDTASRDGGARGSTGSARRDRPGEKFAAGGGREGGSTETGDSVHKNYSENREHLADRRRAWGGVGGDSDSRGGRMRYRSSVEGRGRVDGGVGNGGSGANFGGFAADLSEDAFPSEHVQLVQCPECGRKFTEQALERHAKACRTVFQAKRKVFNASEMRIKGTELEKYAKSKGRGRKAVGRGAEGKGRSHGNSSRSFDETPVNVGGRAKPSKWRQQSSQFRDAIRQARVITAAQKSGKSLSELPAPEPSQPDPSFVACPHCGRRFNEAAGERHMLHCKNIKAKPSVLKKGSGSLLGHAARSASGKATRGQRW